MARGMEGFGPESLTERTNQEEVDKRHSTLRSILRPEKTEIETFVAETYPTPAMIASRVSYAKKAFSDARRVAVAADLEMPKETTKAQIYAELGLLTSIGAGEAVAAFVKKEQN